MKTRRVDDNALTIIPWPSKHKTIVNMTPHVAEMTLEVDLKTSGIVIAVITAYGTYAKNEFINLFFIFPLKNTKGIDLIK